MSNCNARSLVNDMKTLAAKYETLFGRKPLGYVVGVADAMAISKEIIQMGRTTGKRAFIKTLDGLPVHLKVTSGIELLIDYDAGIRIASTHGRDEKVGLVKATIIR